MSSASGRPYVSHVRQRAAENTRSRVLKAAKALFVRHGIDRVTIAQIADKAGVGGSTVYALYKSKEGILRELMKSALFGERFRRARAKLDGVSDPVMLIALTADVARAIYEGESSELALMRGTSAFSPALRKLEQEFETMRFDMQKDRIDLLFAQSKQRKGLPVDEARRILWMYTSREIYRMLVHDGGWTPDRYQQWLSETLIAALVRCEADPGNGRSE
ncbi:MAG TPA: helix-turn-helix domain-containing protein [Bryobacteraceae bacterium]|nr:helix-turn-helix domain-containing protein [Bryobacteraceae bacterium]